jgi:hypothetical protein
MATGTLHVQLESEVPERGGRRKRDRAVVVRLFENKTPEAMAAISPNLITAEPTIDGIAVSGGRLQPGSPSTSLECAAATCSGAATGDHSFGDKLIELLLLALEGSRGGKNPAPSSPSLMGAT